MKKHAIRRPHKPYSGILADKTFWPIGRSPIGIEKDVILGIIGDKLVALLDHYGISGGLDNPENGWLLALMLADERVPSFAPTYRTPAKPSMGYLFRYSTFWSNIDSKRIIQKIIGQFNNGFIHSGRKQQALLLRRQ